MAKERYIVETTFANGETYLQFQNLDDILKELGYSQKKRYFKIPDFETLEEVKIDVGVSPAKSVDK